MNIKPEYHLHGQEKTWLKSKTIEKIALSSNSEPLFYLQELSTGEGRVCFNTELAKRNGVSFSDINNVFDKVKQEESKKYSSNRFKTKPVYFKDSKKNNMVFDDAVNQMFAKRLWTYGSDLKDGQTINVMTAPFINKESAKALLDLIKSNLPNLMNEYDVAFSDIKDNLNRISPEFFELASLKSKLSNIKQSINAENTPSYTPSFKNKI